MANTILITANWHTGALSQQTISRQYDNNRYAVQFIGYPEASEGNELDYYLLVWMSSAPGERPDEIAPIQLASDQWYISNVFTQQTQQIKFQMCALNTEGTFEAHSPIFTGFVRNSLDHDGTTQDIDVSTLFDAYREYLNELIIRAGAVVIDSVPTQGSTNAVSSGGVKSALDAVTAQIPQIDSTLTQSGQAADAKVVGDEISDLKEELSENVGDLKSALCVIGTVNLDKISTSGQYIIASNNTIVSSGNFSMTSPIAVKKGQVIKLTAGGYSNVVGMIATCNSDNTERNTVVRSINTDVNEYVYTVENDGYIVCCYANIKSHQLNISIDYYRFVEPLEESIIFAGNKQQNLTVALAHSFIDPTTNNISTANDFSIFDTITLYRGQTVKFTGKGYNTVIGMINKYDSVSGNYLCIVPSIDSTVREYSYTATETTKIRLCCNVYDEYSCVIVANQSRFTTTDTVENILGFVDVGTTNEEVSVAKANYFVDGANSKATQDSNFNITNTIHLYKSQIIEVTATGYRTSTGMICLYDKNTDSYTTVARSVDSTERKYTYTATEECDVRCSYNKSYPIIIDVVTQAPFSAAIESLNTKVNVIGNKQNIVEYPQMFDNVLCIGDSLTVGYSGDGDAAFAKNYPHYFKKLSVADTTIKAHGGYTAKQVWDNIISVASDLDEYDCAIIYLGTNGGLTDTVSTDCNASDYTQNADTNTGCYGKIIGKILADAPDCKIFCVAGPNEYLGRDTTMNPAVRNLSAFYNVGLVDLSGCILDDNGLTQSAERYLYRPIDGIHYNILGYMTLANVIYNSMMNFMGENRSMYTG